MIAYAEKLPGLGELTLPHLTTLAIPALLRYAWADPAHRRLIAEPDIRNEKAIRRFERHGFELGPEIDLGDKRARLTFLTRSRLSLRSSVAAGTSTGSPAAPGWRPRTAR